MPESPDHEHASRLRKTADKLEEALGELESVVHDLSSSEYTSDDRDDQTAVMSSVIQLAHRDISSAQALVLRASLAHGTVVKRLLRAVLGRPLSEVPAEEDVGGELALDPFRPRLVRCAIQADGLFGTVSMLRSAIEEHEVTKQVDIPEWPDPLVNFAGGMVDGAIENLDAARTLLYQAAELTEERLVHLWAERMLGTKRSREESKS